jgi:hypothetical protein
MCRKKKGSYDSPDFELDGGVVDGHSLCKEGSADGGFLHTRRVMCRVSARHQVCTTEGSVPPKETFNKKKRQRRV